MFYKSIWNAAVGEKLVLEQGVSTAGLSIFYGIVGILLSSRLYLFYSGHLASQCEKIAKICIH